MENKILDKEIEKIVVYDAKNKKELAVITHENVDTASPEILVKIKFKEITQYLLVGKGRFHSYFYYVFVHFCHG